MSETITSTSEFNAAKNAEVLPLYRQALPFYEKAHAIDAYEREYMIALRSIYYNLGDEQKLKEIEAELGF